MNVAGQDFRSALFLGTQGNAVFSTGCYRGTRIAGQQETRIGKRHEAGTRPGRDGCQCAIICPCLLCHISSFLLKLFLLIALILWGTNPNNAPKVNNFRETGEKTPAFFAVFADNAGNPLTLHKIQNKYDEHYND